MLHTTKFHSLTCAMALLALGSVASKTVEAGDATYLPNDASHCEIFRVLSKDVPGECRDAANVPAGMRARSIEIHPPAGPSASPEMVTAPLQADDRSAYVETASTSDELSLAMRIQFEYDSDILTNEAMVSLDSIASVLNSDIMLEKVIMLEGHADATGPADYNLDLSVRRAQSVQTYLIQYHGIEDWRLPFVGKGETEPYDTVVPTAGINRRVEFSNITG